MHSFTQALVLGMAAAATAYPRSGRIMKRDTCILDTVIDPATSTEVAASINQWFSDVTTVNSFLNDVASGAQGLGTSIQQRASSVFVSAADEPCQLKTLSSISDLQGVTDAFTCAVSDLEDVFELHVLDNLQNIINNPNSTSVVTAAVQDINNFRCCNVLPDASILWLDAADDSGISNQVPTCAPREDACSSITCQPSCALDNGVFGSSVSSC